MHGTNDAAGEAPEAANTAAATHKHTILSEWMKTQNGVHRSCLQHCKMRKEI